MASLTLIIIGSLLMSYSICSIILLYKYSIKGSPQDKFFYNSGFVTVKPEAVLAIAGILTLIIYGLKECLN